MTDDSGFAINPERIADSIGMDGHSLSAFVQYNCPAYFTDVSQLELVLDDLSLADVLVDFAFANPLKVCRAFISSGNPKYLFLTL